MQAKIELHNVYQSTSCHITIPLRFLGTLLKSTFRIIRALISKGIRSIYHRMPMTNESKFQLNNFEVVPHLDDGKTTITAFIPYNFLPQTFGGGLRIMNIYESLSNYFNINLVGIVGYGAEFEVHEINDHFTAYLVPMSREFCEYLISEQKKAGGLLHDILLTNDYKMIPRLVDLCKQLVPKTDIFISSQPYLIKMMLEYCSNKILVYDAQNVDYDLKRSYFENPDDNETAKRYLDMVYEVEALGCQKSDFILCVSNEDVEKLCRIYGADQKNIVMVPNGIDVHACRFISAHERMENQKNALLKRKQVIFVGSAHGPNIEAVEFILNEIAEKDKTIQYTIVGNLLSVFKGREIPSNVHFTGMISAEAKGSLYKTADLAINPMFSGSGTNLKVLEYIAYGIPLVSTEFGMRGLEVFNGHIYLAQKKEFAEVIEKTFSLPAKVLEDNARKARKICEDNFDKSVISLSLIDRIREIEKKREATKKRKHKIAIDGRILHRTMTGSERYIYELVKHVSGSRNHQDEYEHCLVNNTGFYMEGVTTIPYVSLNERIDLFHRTYQVSNYNDLLELMIAGKSIFSFLDLILCKNPDYFARKEDHRNYVELMDLALNFSDHIIAISEHAKRDVVAFFNIPEEKIDVVYLGLDFQKFRVVSDTKEIDNFRKAYNLPPKYLLYVGTDYPHKNLKNLYIAFAKIMNLPQMRDYSLVIAGADYYREGSRYLQPYMNPIKHRVISLGHFTDEKIHLLYNAADIFVFPSLYEGFGLTVLEAMACGVPLVCSKAASLPEVAGDAAYMVDANDPELLAKAITDVASNSRLRRTLIERGLERVKQFTWEKCAENTYAVYDKLLSQANGDRHYDEQKLKMLLGRIIDGNMIYLKQNDLPVIAETPNNRNIRYLGKRFLNSVKQDGLQHSTKLVFHNLVRRLR